MCVCVCVCVCVRACVRACVYVCVHARAFAQRLSPEQWGLGLRLGSGSGSVNRLGFGLGLGLGFGLAVGVLAELDALEGLVGHCGLALGRLRRRLHWVVGVGAETPLKDQVPLADVGEV